MNAPIKITRAATRFAVEDLCKEKGYEFHAKYYKYASAYHATKPGECIELGVYPSGTKPNWRGMLQTLGSDWA